MGPTVAWYVLVMFQPEVDRRSMIIGPYLDRDDVVNALVASGTPGSALDAITEGLACELMAMELAVAPGSDGKEIPIIVSPNPPREFGVFHHGEQEIV